MNKFDLASKVLGILQQHPEIFKKEYGIINYDVIDQHDELAAVIIYDKAIDYDILEDLSKYLFISTVEVHEGENLKKYFNYGGKLHIKLKVRPRQTTTTTVNKPASK